MDLLTGRMGFAESLRLAFRALRANRMRSVLTVLGVIVGVAAVVCMVAVGKGAQARVAETIRKMGTNLLYVSPGAARDGGARRASGTRHTLTGDDAAAILREVPGIWVAAPLLARAEQQVVAGNQNWSATVLGGDADYLIAREWPLVSGRVFSAEETESGAKVAIVGQVIAEQLFGGEVRQGDSLRIGGVPFDVIGVLDRKGQAASGRSQDDVVIIPLATARSRVLGGQHEANRHALDLVLVKFSDASSLSLVKQQVQDLLRQRHRLREDAADDFSIFNPTEVLATYDASARTFSLLLASVASISLVVGGISIMNIMLVSVTERTREIGLRMAVGARRSDIRTQFLAEAVALALLGAAIGTILGAAAAVVVARYGGWPVLVDSSAVLLACGFAGLVGVAFGFYPAYRASKLDPMVALRFE